MLAAMLTIAGFGAADALAQTPSRTAAAADVERLPSGLQVVFTHRAPVAIGATPTMDATVIVHYQGSLTDTGAVFDSSFQRKETAEFPLRGVIPGFAEAITRMHVGDEVIATFPAELGYGARGAGDDIPPNAGLTFRIVLLEAREPK